MAKPTRTALVTGGSQGIGFATARVLAERGHRVALAGRTASHLDEAKKRLLSCGVPEERILLVEMSVGDEASMKAGLDLIGDQWGDVEILINNAGRVVPPDPFSKSNIASLRTALEVNLFGTAYLCQELLPPMRERRWGRIVNVASTAGIGAPYRLMPYSVSKAAVIALTKCLAVETAEDGICVNAVAPGPVATENYRAAKGEAAIARRAASIPSRRLADPNDVAAAIGFFASDEAAHVSGEIMAIDGGEQAAGAYSFQWAQVRSG